MKYKKVSHVASCRVAESVAAHAAHEVNTCLAVCLSGQIRINLCDIAQIFILKFNKDFLLKKLNNILVDFFRV